MTTTQDLDTAMDVARKAGDGPIDGFVERLAERIGAKVNVSTVFGDPIERDGITVIPVATAGLMAPPVYLSMAKMATISVKPIAKP